MSEQALLPLGDGPEPEPWLRVGEVAKLLWEQLDFEPLRQRLLLIPHSGPGEPEVGIHARRAESWSPHSVRCPVCGAPPGVTCILTAV